VGIPAEHTDLYNGLCIRVEQIKTEVGLAAFMGTALKSLLRRQGDVLFLDAIRDAYVASAAGHPLEEQHRQARTILQIVIELRPEIAKAWTEAQQKERAALDWQQPDRRSLDAAPRTNQDGTPIKHRPKAEVLTSDFVRISIEKRLASFHLTPPTIPSTAYYHERPLFLFDRNFHKVLARFIADILLPVCRPVLTRIVYSELNKMVAEPSEIQNLLLLKKRTEIEKALIQRLNALSALQHKAEEIIRKAEATEAEGPTWRTIEIPQNRPRSMEILGVKFALGTETVSRKVTIRADGGRDLSLEEMEALTLFTQFRDLAASENVDLPEGCDFQFIRFLMEFDQVKFAQSAKVITELATHSLTNTDFLINKLKREERSQAGGLSDILLLMLFNDASDRGFSIADLHRFCIESSREPQELLRKRPFLYWEVSRRPYELAFQIREAMRQRLPTNTVEITLRMMFSTWKTLARSLFEKDMDVALGVIAAFPIVFAGESCELHFTKIAERLVQVLNDPSPDYESAILAITSVYALGLKSKS